jgi:hypothetical protein
MQVCECMVRQQEDGSEACVRCRGDIYACECPLAHSIKCPDRTDSDRDKMLAYHKSLDEMEV